MELVRACCLSRVIFFLRLRLVVLSLNFAALTDWVAALVAGDIAPQSAKAMSAILSNPVQKLKLAVELAVTMDSMRVFVQATYDLEGDGFISPLVFDRLSALKTHVDRFLEQKSGKGGRPLYPILQSVIINFKPTPAVTNQMFAHAFECVLPAFQYFSSIFFDPNTPKNFTSILPVFESASLFDPQNCSQESQ